MRFHLVDRVDAWESGTTVRARKLTSVTEPYWEDRSGGPVMPRPLVLECLCQAGTWLIMLTTDTRKRAALLSIGTVAFTGDVRPGDVIELDGRVVSMSDEMAVLSGTAKVDGAVVMTAEDVMCALIDAGDLEDVGETDRMKAQLDRSAS